MVTFSSVLHHNSPVIPSTSNQPLQQKKAWPQPPAFLDFPKDTAHTPDAVHFSGFGTRAKIALAGLALAGGVSACSVEAGSTEKTERTEVTVTYKNGKTATEPLVIVSHGKDIDEAIEDCVAAVKYHASQRPPLPPGSRFECEHERVREGVFKVKLFVKPDFVLQANAPSAKSSQALT